MGYVKDKNNDNGNDSGKAYLILGASLGATSSIDLSQADYTFAGEQIDDNAGYSVSGAGDVDGDGARPAEAEQLGGGALSPQQWARSQSSVDWRQRARRWVEATHAHDPCAVLLRQPDVPIKQLKRVLVREPRLTLIRASEIAPWPHDGSQKNSQEVC